MGVSVRQQKRDGKYYVHIRHAGERAAYKCIDEQHALDTQKAVTTAIASGSFSIAALKATKTPAKEESSDVPTLRDYFERHFEPEYLESGVRRSTQEAYRGAFDRHILPELGAKRLDEITRKDVKSLVASLTRKKYQRTVMEKVVEEVIHENGNRLRKEIRKPKMIERLFSKASLRIITASLCAALNHAKEDGYIQDNPAVRLTKLYKQQKAMHEEIQPLTAAEATLFLQVARQHTPDCYTMFLTLLHSGVRSGECAGLQWPDLDFNSKFIVVRRTVIPSGRIEKTKTDRVRRVDLSDELIGALKAHKRERLEKWMKKPKSTDDQPKPFPEWIFANEEGKPPDMHNIKNRQFKRALEKAGLRRIRMHDLRHSYASILISAGKSIAYVQKQLGHQSIKLTVDTYTHLIPGSGREALDALPGLACNSTDAMTAERGH
jgi:integrase